MRVGKLAAVGLTAIVAVGLGACSDDDDAGVDANAPSTTATIALAGGLRLFPHDVAPLPKDGEDPADGIHAVQLLSVDGAASTITVDFIEFLTGEAANAAYDAETGSDEPVPDDYYIRDDEESEVTLDVASDVGVTVIEADAAGAVTNADATFADLPSGFGGPDGPYWITIADGKVERIDEQYVP